MATAIGLAAIIHAFAIYICGCLADFSEGWKKPHLALLVGIVGAMLLMIPQMVLVTEAGPFSPARPTGAGFMLGNGLSILWYVIALAKFFEAGCGGILISVITVQVVSHLAASSLERFMR